MRFSEAITFSVSSKSIKPMMDILGWANTMLSLSFSARYWWPVTFSIYQVSVLSAMNRPAPPLQPTVS